MNSSWFDAFTALKNIGVAEQLAASAQQALELADAEYRAGQTSIIELSQAQLNALQAEIAAASAKYDYQIDRVQLEYECGTLPYPNSWKGLSRTATDRSPVKMRCFCSLCDYSLLPTRSNPLSRLPLLNALSGKSKCLDLCIRGVVFSGHNNILSSGQD